MTYHPPIWGIWSNSGKAMLETGITDLEDAKERIWPHFDAGDASVTIARACPVHPARRLSDMRGRGCRPMLNGDISHREATCP